MKSVPCNLCGNESPRFLFHTRDLLYKTTKEQFSLVICNNCGLVWLDPRPEVFEINHFYPGNYRPHQAHKTQDHSYTMPTNPTKRVLDVGCGWGDFLLELAAKNPTWALYGVDFDERAVHVAQQYGFTIYYGSLQDARYQNSFFDSIHMNHVLEHVHDPLDILCECSRVLNRGGSIKMIIPNFKSFSRMIFGTHWYHIDTPRHLYHFTPKTLTSMLSKAGFEDIHVAYIPSPKYFLQSLALWGSNQKKRYPKILWKVLALPAKIISIAHLSSTMIVTATKRPREAR